MIRARGRIALLGLLVLGAFPVACHRNTQIPKNAEVHRVVQDTTRLVPTVTDTTVVAFFKDTAATNVFAAAGQNFKTPTQRQSLRAKLKEERALWLAVKPRDYQFLLRVGCFCPGTRGWLLMEVRGGQPVRAWDKAGKPAALADWNTFSIDDLYDNLERAADRNGEVQIAFDAHLHFPTYVRTVTLPGPDAWSIVEARGLRPTHTNR